MNNNFEEYIALQNEKLAKAKFKKKLFLWLALASFAVFVVCLLISIMSSDVPKEAVNYSTDADNYTYVKVETNEIYSVVEDSRYGSTSYYCIFIDKNTGIAGMVLFDQDTFSKPDVQQIMNSEKGDKVLTLYGETSYLPYDITSFCQENNIPYADNYFEASLEPVMVQSSLSKIMFPIFMLVLTLSFIFLIIFVANVNTCKKIQQGIRIAKSGVYNPADILNGPLDDMPVEQPTAIDFTIGATLIMSAKGKVNKKSILSGLFMVVIGLVISIGSYQLASSSPTGGRYFITYGIVIAGVAAIIQAFTSRENSFTLYSTYIEGMASVTKDGQTLQSPFRIPLDKIEGYSKTMTGNFIIKHCGIEYTISADKKDIEQLYNHFLSYNVRQN